MAPNNKGTILAYDRETGKIIREFSSLATVSKFLDIPKSQISNTLKNNSERDTDYRTTGGYAFIWRSQFIDIPLEVKITDHPGCLDGKSTQPIVQYDAKTKEQIAVYASLGDAGRVVGIEGYKISERIRRGFKVIKGYRWKLISHKEYEELTKEEK